MLVDWFRGPKDDINVGDRNLFFFLVFSNIELNWKFFMAPLPSFLMGLGWGLGLVGRLAFLTWGGHIILSIPLRWRRVPCGLICIDSRPLLEEGHFH